MEETEDVKLKQQEWEQKKIERARKRIEDAWFKYGLNRLNPGAKEIKLSPGMYQELRDATESFHRLMAHKEGKEFTGKGTLVYSGPLGPIKIISHEVTDGV